MYAPRLSALGFSVRTTIAALLALAIALWMELGEPQWAPMTVWIVAQGTLGESLSKARWRVAGTLGGIVSAIALAAAFPQAPWLFFPALAVWIGLCTALGTLVHNFRSYAFVLTAYTCSIVSLSAQAQPDQVFSIAMARGTYILLGVICGTVADMACRINVPAKARAAIRSQLQQIVLEAANASRDILLEHGTPESDLHNIFSLSLSLGDRIEFSAIEVGRTKGIVDYARATLALASRLMSRALGMRSRLGAVSQRSERTQALLNDSAGVLDRLRVDIDDAGTLQALRQDVLALIARCQQDVEKTVSLPRAENDSGTVFNDRILLQGLQLTLTELQHLLGCLAGDPDEDPEAESYRLARPRNWYAAIHNGLRSCVAVLTAAYVWEVTAWPDGPLFITFVSVVCARFASFSNTVLASSAFFSGAVWAALAAVVPVFLVMPVTASYAMLCLTISVPMLIGGLATRVPALTARAASFSNFFPYLIGLDNHSRINEAEWFNTVLALLSGLGFGVLVFRYVFPFQLTRFYRNFRLDLLSDLRLIGKNRPSMTEAVWVGRIVLGMEQLIAHTKAVQGRSNDRWLHAAFSMMTVGRNLLQLQAYRTQNGLPEKARTILSRLCESFASPSAVPETLELQSRDALKSLAVMENAETNRNIRLLLCGVTGCLIIISSELGHRNEILEGS
ncbi:FUSC family protein [Gluconobacter sp.]|uniref:FUSC family protein n=1 Tax=Gluconobacter sp. TaxID=1876758 RepID=UPI0039E89131